MPPISVVICCANSEDTLEAACKSVAWADELIVVDSGSKDNTAAIAQKYATRYVLEPWRGYTGQKLFATDLCSHDWVFFLDGDEECTPQLGQEWKAISDSEAEKVDLYLVPRENYVMGRKVRAWWPDHLTRIFHRKRCTWDHHVLHDTRQPSHPSRVRKLKGWLIHKRLSKGAFSDYFNGALEDSRLMPVARQMYERGKRCHWWDMAFRPVLAFLKYYFIKRGFLDGVFGLMMAQRGAVGAQLKYAALWTVQEEHRKQSSASTSSATEK